MELSDQGGHAAFISGRLPAKPVYWLEQRIPDYLKQVFAEDYFLIEGFASLSKELKCLLNCIAISSDCS